MSFTNWLKPLRAACVLPVLGASVLASTACQSSASATPPGPTSAPSPSSQANPTGPAAPATTDRAITFNGRTATASELQILARFERAWGIAVPTGDYWYDNVSGAAGLWGGPMRGVLGAGLGLGGGPVPASASGGGNGQTTGVFINGRELHPLDVQGLTGLLGQAPWPGRWWVDGAGNFGAQGQGPAGNLVALMQRKSAARSGGNSYYASDIASGKSTFVGGGCAAVSGRLSPSDSNSSYSYYVGCE